MGTSWIVALSGLIPFATGAVTRAQFLLRRAWCKVQWQCYTEKKKLTKRLLEALIEVNKAKSGESKTKNLIRQASRAPTRITARTSADSAMNRTSTSSRQSQASRKE